jgi:hypothetical protein
MFASSTYRTAANNPEQSTSITYTFKHYHLQLNLNQNKFLHVFYHTYTAQRWWKDEEL